MVNPLTRMSSQEKEDILKIGLHQLNNILVITEILPRGVNLLRNLV